MEYLRRRRLPADARCPTTCSSATTPPGSTAALSINPMAKPARQAGDDQLPGGLQLPPDVPRRRRSTFLYGNDSAVARAGHHRGRRHPRHRQRRRDDRHGRADHAAGRRDARAAAVRAGHGRHASSSSSCRRTRAFMHLDTAMTMVDRDAFSRLPLPARRAALVHPRRPTAPAATSRSRRTTTCSRSSPTRSGSTRSGCCGRRSTGWAPQREQWDDGNNFLAVVARRRSSATSATPRPTATSPTTASRSSRSSAPSWAAAAAARAA